MTAAGLAYAERLRFRLSPAVMSMAAGTGLTNSGGTGAAHNIASFLFSHSTIHVVQGKAQYSGILEEREFQRETTLMRDHPDAGLP